MRSFAVLSGLAAIALAQEFPINIFSSVKVPSLQGPTLGKGATSESKPYDANSVYQSSYNAAAASGTTSSRTSKRRNVFDRRTGDAPCSLQPVGAGPAVSPDTPDAFLTWPAFSAAATGATTPANYVNTFTDLHASSSVPMGYLGYDSYTSYDVAACAAKCDALSGCFAFNMFFERSPTLNPDVNCTNPASTTVIKCAYWATIIDKSTATNQGQTRNDFKIVVAGSNGYISQKVNVPGYDYTYLAGTAINAPTECNSLIGSQVWTGDAYDPSRCAAWCEGTSQYNIDHLGGRSICRFFDTYIWLKDGVPVGQVCAMYTRSWDASYATNVGQYDNDGHHYTIAQSFTFSNTTDPGANICDATCMSQNPCPVSSSSSTTLASSTTPPASSSTSTTVSASTTPAVSTTTTSASTTTAKSSSTTPSTTAVITTTSSSKVITTTTSSTTTGKTYTTSCTTTTGSAKITTTSTKCTTTTLQTSTTKCTTTSASPTPTQGKCFKLKISSSYITISSNGKLAYSTSSAATVFSINKWNYLTVTSTCKPVLRTIENWFDPFYGYMSTQGILPLLCGKNSDNTLKIIGLSSENSIWTSSKDTGVMHGNCPGNGWLAASLVIENADCPADYKD